MFGLANFIDVIDKHSPIIPNSNIHTRSEEIRKHITAKELRTFLSPDEFNYFKFAFVRNPWDLHVSQYHYFVQTTDHPSHVDAISKKSFDEYIEWRIITKRITQKSYCFDEYNMLVDYIGRYENLQNDFLVLCKRIGIESTRLPVTNSSVHNNYQLYYNNRTKRLIERAYQEDIELFKYKF